MNFDWVDSVDSGSKKQPYQRFGTGHRFGGVPITTNCPYIGLMIPIIWAIYTQSHKKQYIFLSEHLLCGTCGTRTAYVSGSHGSLPTHWFQLVAPERLEPVVQVLVVVVVVVVGAASPFVSTIQSVLSDQGSGRSTC